MGNLHLSQAVTQYERGITAAGNGHLEEALAAFSKAVEIEPTYTEAITAMGTAQAQLGRYEEARATLTPVLDANPDNPIVLYGMALVFLGLDDSETAYEMLSRAAQGMPDEPDILFSFGTLFNLLGYPEDAVDLFRQIIALDASYLGAYMALGSALAEMGEMQDAIATLRQAVDIAPQEPATHTALGVILMLAGEFRDAANILRRALALDERQPQAHMALAEVLCQLGETHGAIKEADRAMTLAPCEPGALFSAADVYASLDRLPEAKDLLLRGLALDPDDHEAHMKLMEIAALLNDHAILQQEYEYMRAVDPVTASMLANALGIGSPKPRTGRKATPKPVAVDASMVYQLKVTLKGIRPPIWRRILVPAHTTLAQLHDIIQVAMGWTNSHLHAFEADRMQYSDPDFDLGLFSRNEAHATLAQVAPTEKSRITYEYDFGDSWQHDILVEKILPGDPAVRYPVCVKGKRNGPLEDIGGVWGYANYLEAISDSNHPDHTEMVSSYGDDYDPDTFDIDDVNAQFARMR